MSEGSDNESEEEFQRPAGPQQLPWSSSLELGMCDGISLPFLALNIPGVGMSPQAVTVSNPSDTMGVHVDDCITSSDAATVMQCFGLQDDNGLDMVDFPQEVLLNITRNRIIEAKLPDYV